MTTPVDIQRELSELLDAGTRAAETLAGHLQAERAALETEDLEALGRAAQAKEAVLSDLERVESRRSALLARCGLAADSAAMQALGERCDDPAVLTGKWQHYLAVADDCQRVNTTNGAILRLRQQQIASTLAVLTGGREATYGPRGSGTVTATRDLGEA